MKVMRAPDFGGKQGWRSPWQTRFHRSQLVAGLVQAPKPAARGPITVFPASAAPFPPEARLRRGSERIFPPQPSPAGSRSLRSSPASRQVGAQLKSSAVCCHPACPAFPAADVSRFAAPSSAPEPTMDAWLGRTREEGASKQDRESFPGNWSPEDRKMPAACDGDTAASIQQKLYFTKKLTFNDLFV